MDVKIWKFDGEKTVADCKVFKVKAQTFAHPDGRRAVFFINESQDWVQVAPLVRDGERILTVLVKQFRFGTRRMSWELDRKSTRLNSSHSAKSRMPSSA